MARLLRLVSVGMLLTYAAPVFAQMSFEGLDLSDSKKKKKKKTEPKTEKPPPEETKPAEQAKPPDTATDTKKTDTKKDDGLGLDLSAPNPADRKPKDAKDKKTAPTMTFEAVDVSGKTGDRQRLDAATNQF